MLSSKKCSVVFSALVLIVVSAPTFARDAWHVEGIPTATHEDIRFSNGDVHLAGTLYLPASGEHVPAVVVEHGAEAPTRDFALYEHLAQTLPSIGIAVLVYDRRGSGASSGDRETSSYEDFADDAIAGQQAIAKNPRIDAHKIGFWGLSQGGWLSILAANRSKSAAFAISVSAPLVTPDVQMNFAVANLVAARGFDRNAVDTAMAARKAHDAFTLGKLSRAETLKALAKADNQPWSSLTFIPSADQLTKSPQDSRWRKEMLSDPLREAREARVPVLFIYGGADPWVPVTESIARLQTLMPEHPNFEYHVIAGADHSMNLHDKDPMAFDEASLKSTAPDAPEYFVVLADWLARHVR